MRRSVLLVDDSPTARLAIGEALRSRGIDVIAIGAVSEIEDVLARATPDLFLVDVHMPEMFGDDLVPWLRSEKQVARPILLCSTRSEAELERLAEACGADGWIRKGGRPDEFAACVARHLARSARTPPLQSPPRSS